MVRDGYFYAAGLLGAAVLVAYFASPAWASLPLLLAIFFVQFFRDPEREIPTTSGAIVSPGDGHVTDVATVAIDGRPRTRISIFLSVFDVHVNRSPISGVITKVEYRRGKFMNAMAAACADQNEQNIVTVAAEGQEVIFKQIAGLLARRIVFTKSEGDVVGRGERVGLIKFGSRVDVIFDPAAVVQVKRGDRVHGGSSVLAVLPVAVGQKPQPELVQASSRNGGRS